MKKELEKTYNPKGMEDRIYANWLDKKYFHAEVDETKKPIVLDHPVGVVHQRQLLLPTPY